MNRWSPLFYGCIAALVTGCAPQSEQQAPPTTEATTGTQAAAGAVTRGMSTQIREDVTSAVTEWHAQPPPPDFKLPFPDAFPATDIEPGKPGGNFTLVAFGDGPKTFDPITANDSGSNEVIARIYEYLLGFDNKKQVFYPALLKDCYMEADKSIWTMRLRSGLKWSDGQPITADDILFSAQVIYDPKIVNAGADVLQVAGKPFVFEKVDDLTVRVKLAAPSGSFHALIASFPIIPKHALEAAYKAGTYEQAQNINVDPAKVVCSGPFKLKQYQSGERVILERNPNYHHSDKNGTRLPYLDTLIITYAPDMDAQQLRFQRGEADGFVRPRPDSIPTLHDGQAAGNYTLYDLGVGEGANVFWFNLKQGNNPESGKPFVVPQKLAWFRDDRFRKAALHALDKEGVIRTELRGLAVSVWSLESPSITFWHNPNIAKYPFDQARAKALLDEMGLKDANGDGIREDTSGNKVSFTFITNKGNKVRERVATLIAQDLRSVGVEAVPQFIDFNTLVKLTGDTFEYEACLLGFGGGGTHPCNSMNVYRSSGRTHFINPSQKSPSEPWEAEVDALAEPFNATLDVMKQREMYFKMQAIFAEHCAFLPLWTSKVFVAARNKFGNLKPSPLDHELLWNAEEIYVK